VPAPHHSRNFVKHLLIGSALVLPLLLLTLIIFLSRKALTNASEPQPFGFIDKSGKDLNAATVIPPRYYIANPFSEGLAAVSVDDATGKHKWSFIDTTGKVVINEQFDNANHSDSLCPQDRKMH
jgi:hypothetical protein